MDCSANRQDEGGIDEYRKNLAEQKQVLLQSIDIAFARDITELWQADLYVFASSKRAIDICDSTLLLFDHNHLPTAAALVRLQIDTLIRLRYFITSRRSNEIAGHLLRGGSFRDLRDKDGRPLHDKTLRELAADDFPWLESMYNQASAFVHLTGKHLFHVLRHDPTHADGVIISIEPGISDASSGERVSILKAAARATGEVAALIEAWRRERERMKRLLDTHPPLPSRSVVELMQERAGRAS